MKTNSSDPANKSYFQRDSPSDARDATPCFVPQFDLRFAILVKCGFCVSIAPSLVLPFGMAADRLLDALFHALGRL